MAGNPQQTKDNSENMAKVRNAISQAKEVNMGKDLKNGVYIDYTSDFGNNYQGTVVFKRPSVRDFMKMGAIKSEFLRKSGATKLELLDDSVKFLAHVTSVLKVVVAKCPEWLLDVEAVEEVDVLYEVFAEYKKWENSFRRELRTTEDGDSEASE